MEAARHGEVIAMGPLVVEPEASMATVEHRALALSVRELQVLVALARRHGRIVSREELHTNVWGGEFRKDDRSVDVYVSKLRAKLEDALPGWHFIHTHFGFGYRLAPEPSHPFHMPATSRQQTGEAAMGASRTSNPQAKEQA